MTNPIGKWDGLARSKKLTAFVLLSAFVALVSVVACPALAAEFVVTNLNDDGPGSLRDAVNQANAADDADTIMFDFSGLPGGGQRIINLTSGGLLLEHDVNIIGLGPRDLAVQRSTDVGTPEFRLFNVTFGNKEVMISGMTIRNGDGGDFGGGALFTNAGNKVQLHDAVVENNTAAAPGEGTGGGAILNAGELTITTTVFSGNSVTMPNEGTATGGGAIFNTGTLSVHKSVFSENTATEEEPNSGTFHFGGAIFNGDGGTLNVTNSSFDGNKASIGGAVYNASGGTAGLNNNTITGNEARRMGAGGVSLTSAPSIDSIATLSAAIATNPASPPIYSTTKPWGRRSTRPPATSSPSHLVTTWTRTRTKSASTRISHRWRTTADRRPRGGPTLPTDPLRTRATTASACASISAGFSAPSAAAPTWAPWNRATACSSLRRETGPIRPTGWPASCPARATRPGSAAARPPT